MPWSSVENGKMYPEIKGEKIKQHSTHLRRIGVYLRQEEFVVDSGASMHMISKKDVNSAELETVTKSRSRWLPKQPMVKCRRMKRPRCTSENLIYSWRWNSSRIRQQVLSLGKLCDEHGDSYEWTNGQKPNLIKNGIRIKCNTENFVPIVVPG